jgi:glycosyltransferase involved in cell wall biosynthesis
MKRDPARQPLRDERPTICQLVHTLNVGGAEILAREFALRSAGDLRFVFACLDECGLIGDELRQRGYPVAVLERRPGFDLRCVRRLAHFCREHYVRLIHAHQYGPFFYAELASRFARRVPVLFTEHGRDWPDYRRPKRVLANKLLLRRRDCVVAVGEHVRRALLENEGLPPQRVAVIYNGIDCQSYSGAAQCRAETRASWELNDDHLVIVQVARLNRLKDHATALRAMKKLAASVPQARLVLVGDGEERAALEKLTDELQLRGAVLFVGMQTDVARMLAAADLFLLSSVSEGIPLTLLEAMAAGLPSVATRVGGIPEVVVDGQTGLLAEAANPEDLAAKLQAVLADGAQRRRMGAAAAARAREHFDAGQMHAAYNQVFGEMLGVRKPITASPVQSA